MHFELYVRRIPQLKIKIMISAKTILLIGRMVFIKTNTRFDVQLLIIMITSFTKEYNKGERDGHSENCFVKTASSPGK